MPDTTLTKDQLLSLRRRGHHLEPVVRLGQQGLTESVLREIHESLEHHELIKVRVLGDDRASRDAMIADICTQLDAALVQRIGHVALLFRRQSAATKNKKKKNRRGSGINKPKRAETPRSPGGVKARRPAAPKRSRAKRT